MKYLLRKSLLLMLTISLGVITYGQNNNLLLQEVIKEKSKVYNLTLEDIRSWEITDFHEDSKRGISYYYLTQTFENLHVHNAISVIAIKNQKAYLSSNQFISNLAKKVQTTSATISTKEAILFATHALGLKYTGEIAEQDRINKYHFIYKAKGLSLEDINVRLKLFMTHEETIRAVWDLDIYQLDQKHWWHVRIDAQTGKLLDKADWVSQCDVGPGSNSHAGRNHTNTEHTNFEVPTSSALGASYNVFAVPVESPSHGSRTLVVDPENPAASPYGWHDINGVPGAEFTTTFGNNVYAYEDRADKDQAGYSPEGGASLNFNFPLDLSQHPQTNEDAAITNLFYMNNIMHDVWYNYGFTEASGNFQRNNYGKGGLEGDQVYAEAQDGGGTNNANFATPPDGGNPRMQMYLWSSPTPEYLTINSPTTVSGPYISQPANFGPPIPTVPLTADLALYNDNTSNPIEACSPAVNGAELNNKIVIIRRGNCNFTQKVAHAEAEGALAVIVVNNATGNPIVMGGTDPGIGIPSIMVSMADGEALITQIQDGATVNGTLQDVTSVQLDGDFDNGIIAHEYGHGISIRLTGGASTSACLNNREQMGEGWSDWFGLMLTIKPGDLPEDPRGIGTYAIGESPSGVGIRPLPYSTDFNVNFITYAHTNNTGAISMPHGIGFVWATMLWDLTWALVDKYGMDADVYNGTGGNNIAMNLVIQGLKLQGCSPGFVDGRDAILLADDLLYNGENTCLIWGVFANRGLGFSADQGSSNSRTDQVEAFDLPPYVGTSYATETVTSCTSYTWPTNNQTYTTSGTYTEYLMNSFGCDSIVTLNLTISEAETNVINEEACGSYTWSANNQTYTTSGVYAETLSTVEGCDSIVTLNLTISEAETNVINEEACGSYTWLANNQTYTASGVYTETLSTVEGCDSIVTLNLTINEAGTNSINKTACESYTWSANNQTYTASGVYTETLSTVEGCDSIVTLNLTISEAETNSINKTACESYTWLANNQTYTASGVYTETLSTVYGCDSIVTLNLTIGEAETTSINKTACESYTWSANNQTYIASGVYTETLSAVEGCDSIIALNLSIVNIDTDIMIDFDEHSLVSPSGYSSYQWISCDDNFAPIPGAVNSTYIPSQNGSYAVIITDGTCTDTSACLKVNILDLYENKVNSIKVYPNPTNGLVKIEFMDANSEGTIRVYNMTGQLIQEFKIDNQEHFQFILKGETGVYTIEHQSSSGNIYRQRLTKIN